MTRSSIETIPYRDNQLEINRIRNILAYILEGTEIGNMLNTE